MPKTPPPLLGFNNNVKHRGRIFHIQTEDSGVKRPHVITHLFADGGRIVQSRKTNYAEHVGREDTAQVVRRVMKEQHKAMFIALRGGEYDDLIEQICGEHPLPPAPLPKKLQDAIDSQRGGGEHGTDPHAAGPHAAGQRSGEHPAVTSPAAVEPKPAPRPSSPPGSRRASNPNLQRITPELERAAPRAPIDIDIGSQLSSPPAPPREITPVHGTPAIAARVEEERRPSRYAPSRPAAIFEARPDQGSIFGGGISEQSLDDVILSYIAEDLDEEDPALDK